MADLKAELEQALDSASRGARLIQEAQAQHASVVGAWRALCERFGIQGQPIGAKQLRERLVAAGMKPGDNTFSRELVAIREE
jgi:hypothetical protein